MKKFFCYLLLPAFLLLGKAGLAQDNPLMKRSWWKTKPSLSQVKEAVQNGYDPSALDANDFDPVVWALLEQAEMPIIEYLLSQEGNEVNKITHDGRTYVFWAAYKNRQEVMRYLVANGAKTDLRDDHGNTVLTFVARTGQKELSLYEYLITLGANPITEKDRNGANVLHLLTPHLTDDTLLNYFEDKGVSLTEKDVEGNTAMAYLIKGKAEGFENKLALLTSRGLHPTEPQAGGETLWHLAVKKNDFALLQKIAPLGINVNATDVNGLTPLHLAAMKAEDTEILSYLVNQGADTSVTTSFGESMYDLASENELLQPQLNHLEFLK